MLLSRRLLVFIVQRLDSDQPRCALVPAYPCHVDSTEYTGEILSICCGECTFGPAHSPFVEGGGVRRIYIWNSTQFDVGTCRYEVIDITYTRRLATIAAG